MNKTFYNTAWFSATALFGWLNSKENNILVCFNLCYAYCTFCTSKHSRITCKILIEISLVHLSVSAIKTMKALSAIFMLSRQLKEISNNTDI